MSVTIGSHTFDDVHYDAGGDVLYLHKGDPSTDVDWAETPEAHGISFDRTGELAGVIIVRARWTLDNHGKIAITLPEHIELGPGAVDEALAAA
jgi:uncharacterized protein YuzE